MKLEQGRLHLGLDVGTQSTKGLVIDLDRGAVIARAQATYGMIEGLPQGAAEQHPDTWWSAIGEVLNALRETVDFTCLKGIGVSGQQHGFVPLDRDGAVIRAAKLWCDTSTSGEAAHLSQQFGRAVPTGFTAPKILWMKRNEPELFARLAAIALPHDWVNLKLSGRLFSEAGDASGTGLFDPLERAFRPDDAASIDARLPDALPMLVSPREVAASVSEAAANELGLPPGLPIAPGGGDNMMSAIGSGAVREGVSVVSLGTSGTVFGCATRPVVDPEGLIAPFCDSTGRWLPLLCTMNVTGVTEEVRGLYDGFFNHDALTEMASEVEPGSDGVLFLPFLQGERVPDLPRATGTLRGLRAGSLRPGRLYRAAIEGASLNLAWGIDRLSKLGMDTKCVYLVGGGARNALWPQILADMFDSDVRVLSEPESAALGAALQSAWVTSDGAVDHASLSKLVSGFVQVDGPTFEPNPATVVTYRVLGDRFRDAVASEFG